MEKETKKSTATRKIRNLRQQYNKILVGIFDENAADCIERALEDTDGAFGENIHAIIDSALDNLRVCITKELEIDGGEMGDELDLEIGGECDCGLDDCDTCGGASDTDTVALGPGIALGIDTEVEDDDDDGDKETEDDDDDSEEKEEDSEDDEETD